MTPLIQAEQAVLGSVFLDPGQLEHLSPWLRPEHFYRPAHAALYAAMIKLRADGHPATTGKSGDPIPLSWMTDTVQEAEHQDPWAHRVVRPFLDFCMSARHPCPRLRADGPGGRHPSQRHPTRHPPPPGRACRRGPRWSRGDGPPRPGPGRRAR
ncbi:DnaB-like helicase N-terminal domain-containing protein [Streptomyces lasalocidi]